MNKPDELTLLAYLYGELEDKERHEVEEYLAAHPAARAQVEQWRSVREVLAQGHDQEVLAPPIAGVPSARLSHRGWQIPLGIAAAFLVVMWGAWLLNIQVRYQTGELSIAFGAGAPASSALSADQVNQLIEGALARQEEVLAQRWEEQQQAFFASVQAQLRQQTGSPSYQQWARVVSKASQDEIQRFVSEMREENQHAMEQYLQLSAADQRHYIEGILAAFTEYVEQQRMADLRVVNNRLSELQQGNRQLREDTETVLTQLLAQSTPVVSTAKAYE